MAGTSDVKSANQQVKTAATSQGTLSRRQAMTTGAILSAMSIATCQPQVAAAAASIQNGQIQRSFQPSDLLSIFSVKDELPPPVKFPRRPLNQRFAVLLMQSGYKAAESMKFIPMDTFQVNFWKLRQQLWAPYTKALAPLLVRQGNLSDASYFDFVSAVQFLTLSTEFPKGQLQYEEFCETCPTNYKVVHRETSLRENTSLPPALLQRAGDRLYEGLSCDGYDFGQSEGKERFGGPAAVAPGASFDEVLKGIGVILNIFENRGFCTKAGIHDVQRSKSGLPGSQFTVTLTQGANLWGLAALMDRNSSIANVYDALAVGGFLRASGIEHASFVVTTNGTSTSTHWTL